LSEVPTPNFVGARVIPGHKTSVGTEPSSIRVADRRFRIRRSVRSVGLPDSCLARSVHGKHSAVGKKLGECVTIRIFLIGKTPLEQLLARGRIPNPKPAILRCGGQSGAVAVEGHPPDPGAVAEYPFGSIEPRHEMPPFPAAVVPIARFQETPGLGHVSEI